MEQTPFTENTSRAAALQRALAENNIDLALVRQVADLFYYTGTHSGWLPGAGPPGPIPCSWCAGLKQRAVAVPPDWPQVFYQDMKELPGLLDRAGLAPQGVLGLEFDVIPAALYKRFQEQLFPQHPIRDVSPLIRRQRMVKSPYEIEQLRRAAAILDQVHEQVPELLQPGISELELSAALEYRLRLLGHQGHGPGAQLGPGTLLRARALRDGWAAARPIPTPPAAASGSAPPFPRGRR